MMIRRYATVRVWQVFPPKAKRNPLGTVSVWDDFLGRDPSIVPDPRTTTRGPTRWILALRGDAVRGADRRHIATGETARRENCERKPNFFHSTRTLRLRSVWLKETLGTLAGQSHSRNRASRNVCEVPDGGRDADDGARESDDERDARKNGRGGADDDGVARCDVERRARWRENGVRRRQERRASRARARDADPRRTTPVGFGCRGDV